MTAKDVSCNGDEVAFSACGGILPGHAEQTQGVHGSPVGVGLVGRACISWWWQCKCLRLAMKHVFVCCLSRRGNFFETLWSSASGPCVLDPDLLSASTTPAKTGLAHASQTFATIISVSADRLHSRTHQLCRGEDLSDADTRSGSSAPWLWSWTWTPTVSKTGGQ